MPIPFNQEVLDALIGRIFLIEDITLGGPKQGYAIRYRGRLRSEDTEAAYNQVEEAVKPYGLTPLFRAEGGGHIIYLAENRPEPRPDRPWINLVLFLTTLLSVLFVGGTYGLQTDLPSNIGQAALFLIERGWPFAVSMIAILGTHELGHYFAGRAHGVRVTLPFFIPMPFSAFGTMGAFISMKGQPKNRKHLFDIGIAGPLSGFVVAVIVLIIGLRMSSLGVIDTNVPEGMALSVEGNSILYLLLKYLVFGQLLPAPAHYTLPPLVHWIVYFFSGRPSPLGATDVMLSPGAWAGGAGLLVTTLNLIPAGQLDGGHILYVLFGAERSRKIVPFILIALGLLGLAWNGWWLWALLIFFLGRSHAEPLDEITPLDKPRRILGYVLLFIFFITFVPVPLT